MLKIKNLIRYILLRKNHVYIDFRAMVLDCSFDGYNSIGYKSFLSNVKVGKGTYIRDNCHLKKTRIGKYCSIAPNVRIVYGNHPVTTYVSMHPSFFTDRMIAGLSFNNPSDFKEYSYVNENEDLYCEIGNDVWIGTGAMIMSGISIGNGAVIAAGSIVTKNVEPYSIVAGVPARKIKYRFTHEQITLLEEFRWWDKDDQWILQNINSFNNIEEFIDTIR